MAKIRNFLLFPMLALIVSCFLVDGTNGSERKVCASYDHKICPCGDNGKKIAVPIKNCFKEDFEIRNKSCEPCNKAYFDDDLCKNFKNCEKCMFGIKHCAKCPEGRYGPFCNVEVKNASKAEAENMDPIFPLTFDIPPGQPLRFNRILREVPGVCAIRETSMDTATIKCTVFSDSVKCHIQCIWGYTLDNEASRDISCDFKENVWKPKLFEECKPYVNCIVKMVGPGKLDCLMNDALKPPVCKIRCLGNDATAEREYVCNIDGSFSPPLPKCAEKGVMVTGIVKPPNC